MNKIIDITEFRKRRCLEALLADINLPRYCDECGDVDPELLAAIAANAFAAFEPSMPAQASTMSAPALIVPFPGYTIQDDDRQAAAPTIARRASSRRAPRE